jgi:NAD(P)-dependent dehydrogenase (short-subunit alcohol dehydrogenase family)
MSGAFQDQVAVITGAATGLGLAIARRLARSGVELALLDGWAGGLYRFTGEQLYYRFYV